MRSHANKVGLVLLLSFFYKGKLLTVFYLWVHRIKVTNKQCLSHYFLHYDYRVFFKNNLIIYIACLWLRDTVHHLTHLAVAPGKHLQLL